MTKTDEYIKDVVVAAIRRRSVDMEIWLATRLWDEGDHHLKAALGLACKLSPGELPILYSYVHQTHWTLVTTRRIWSSVGGHVGFVDASEVVDHHPGNFKGLAMQMTDEMRLTSRSGEVLRCPYGTGKPGRGTLYAVLTLRKVSKSRDH